MIQSMTGFGRHILQLPNKKITIEIKSLNSKNLDVNVRMPSYYKEKEIGMRKLIAKKLIRGKVDISLFVEMTGEETSSSINNTIVSEYIKQLKLISQEGSDMEYLQVAMRLPDAMKTERDEIDDEEWSAIEVGINIALEKIETFRIDEGVSLEKDFTDHINNIAELLKKVIIIDPDRITAVKARLNQALSELEQNVDENRFEQELVYYLEKYDINEEKVRLDNHLDYFIKTLNSPESNGKKLGFISQEIGREINTIGSKANYAEMQ
ncbi:MAG: YicC family protein, partial [Flavobacteriaceae bacterium]|nr:YicC family protein [Flavobacteriaceae bacterium]